MGEDTGFQSSFDHDILQTLSPLGYSRNPAQDAPVRV
jgi:hypothetical protein